MSAARKSEYIIALLPGDGIGPEIVAQARRVLDAVAELRAYVQFEEGLIGGAAIDATGTALPDETIGDVQARRRRAARRGRWARSGTIRRRRCGPSRDCWRSARRSVCSPTCVPSRRIRRCSPHRRSSPSSSPASTSSSCASSPAASTSARRGSSRCRRRRARARRVHATTPRRSSASCAWRPSSRAIGAAS